MSTLNTVQKELAQIIKGTIILDSATNTLKITIEGTTDFITVTMRDDLFAVFSHEDDSDIGLEFGANSTITGLVPMIQSLQSVQKAKEDVVVIRNRKVPNKIKKASMSDYQIALHHICCTLPDIFREATINENDGHPYVEVEINGHCVSLSFQIENNGDFILYLSESLETNQSITDTLVFKSLEKSRSFKRYESDESPEIVSYSRKFSYDMVGLSQSSIRQQLINIKDALSAVL